MIIIINFKSNYLAPSVKKKKRVATKTRYESEVLAFLICFARKPSLIFGNEM